MQNFDAYKILENRHWNPKAKANFRNLYCCVLTN